MSLSLLKKSMAIVEDDMESNKKLKEKEIAKKKKVHKKDRYADTLFKNPAQKKTIDDIRKEMQSNLNRADDNIRKLLSLTKYQAKIPNAEKIIQRAHTGRYIVEEKKKEVEQESIFTEEDFAAFEKELAQTI